MSSDPPDSAVPPPYPPLQIPPIDPGTMPLSRCILVAEDQFLIATDIIQAFQECGFSIAGPVSSLEEAMALLDDSADLAGAVVDLRLRGDLAYPLIDRLLERGVPVVLSTGYDSSEIPERYLHLPCFEKPIAPQRLVAAFRPESGLTSG